jgi:hypothetical protein
METAVKELAENYDLDIDSPLVHASYEIVKNSDKNEISKILKKYYRPTILHTNTIGAYLWGGLQNYYGEVSKSCSVLSNGSFFDNEETCQYQIWTYKNGIMKLRGDSLSSKAYIYVEEDWQGFNYSDIEKLQEAGIENAAVLNTIDNKHSILLKMCPLTHLPVLKNFEDEVKDEIVKHENSSLPYYIFLLIFLIIFIKIYYSHLVS